MRRYAWVLLLVCASASTHGQVVWGKDGSYVCGVVDKNGLLSDMGMPCKPPTEAEIKAHQPHKKPSPKVGDHCKGGI
jgi:hypothetical protein